MDKRNFRLELGEPTVITFGKNVTGGPWQFPKLLRTRSGGIYAKWSMGIDRVEGGGHLAGEPHAISDDNGKTWRKVTDKDAISYDVIMSNGKAFAYFEGKPAHEVAYDLKKYSPACEGSEKTSVYFADDIKELDRNITAVEYDPKTGEKNTFAVTVNWPYMPATVYHRDYGDIIYPLCQVFAISNGEGALALDDGLYYCTYCRGFNSVTGEVTKYSGYLQVYIFRSTDCARTWNLVSQILIEDENYHGDEDGIINYDGFCEPKMKKMPDGSVVMLLRTGHRSPSYIVRSIDNCKTWSKPVVFDDIGVFPQMVCLQCGVTVAVYGRPEMRIRATLDPHGLEWEAPMTMELNPAGEGKRWFQRSCFNTSALALDENTVLMAYSDFNVPNENGEPTKAVMVRTITAVFDE